MSKDEFQIVLYGATEGGLAGDLAMVTGYTEVEDDDGACYDADCCSGGPSYHDEVELKPLGQFKGGLKTILDRARRHVVLMDNQKYSQVTEPTLDTERGVFTFTAERPLGIPEKFKRADILKALKAIGIEDIDKLHSISFNFKDNRSTVQSTASSPPDRIAMV